MRDALERILQQRSAMIGNLFRKRPEDESVDRPASAIEPPAKAQAERHRARIARFDEVKAMFNAGRSLRGIAAALDLHHETVIRYVRSDVCPDWRAGCRRPSRLDRFADTIEQRLRDGCRNTRQILRELHEMGYRGGKTAVGVYVRRLEGELGISPRCVGPLAPRAGIPSARRLAVSAVRRPDHRSAEDRRSLDHLRENDGEIREGIDLAASFAALVRGRRPDELNGWLIRAEGSSVAGLRSFARRLRQDEAAVRAGMTVEWSNGPVEGHVSRLKSIKRSMYGRARFDLLKARVLQAV